MSDSIQTPQNKPTSEQPQSQPQRQGSFLTELFRGISSVSKTIVVGCIVLLLILLGATWYVFHSIGNSRAQVDVDRRIAITPTQIASIQRIGQWEFLSIADEELVDTLRRGFFSDDELIRIYYGTLRLGIDMSKAQSDWITTNGDSIIVILPSVQLLDDRFIDETRTQSFFEKGSWTDADREAMYQTAYTRMKARCLNAANIKSAEENASRQFYQLIRSMGFSNVCIRFSDKVEK